MHQERHRQFIHRLAGLTLDDLERVAAAIEDAMMSSADWLEWKRAVAVSDGAVRRRGRAREAGAAAHEAAAAVRAALEGQLVLPDPRVTMVARAAREAAAVLVGLDGELLAGAAVLRPWRGLLGHPLAA